MVGILKNIVFSEIDAITAAISISCEPVVIPELICRPLKSEAQKETGKDVIKNVLLSRGKMIFFPIFNEECSKVKLEGIYRKDIYELPPDSIRELIINAVMNCGYLQNSHIHLAIYDDRLGITSPGGLMPGVTLDKMKEGYSKIRNRALAHAFSYMNLIEAWGRAFRS